MNRRVTAAVVAIALSLVTTAPAGAWSQIFGFRELGDSYAGVESYMSA